MPGREVCGHNRKWPALGLWCKCTPPPQKKNNYVWPVKLKSDKITIHWNIFAFILFAPHDKIKFVLIATRIKFFLCVCVVTAALSPNECLVSLGLRFDAREIEPIAWKIPPVEVLKACFNSRTKIIQNNVGTRIQPCLTTLSMLNNSKRSTVELHCLPHVIVK